MLAELDRDPGGRLREVPGIGPMRLRAAVASWEAQGAQRAVRLFLDEHGVPAAAAGRIARALGPGAIERLRADPWSVAEVDGVGFATADALARGLGTPPDDPGRLDAGLLHALGEAEADGHCFLPRAELAARARRLLGVDAAGRIDALAAAGRLAVDPGADAVAHPVLDRVEARLARRARALCDAAPQLRLRAAKRPTAGFVPTDRQWSVVELVLGHRLVVLTGGPGTGKTSSMQALVDVLRGAGRSVRLCAPTGKAARRLAETTGAPGHDDPPPARSGRPTAASRAGPTTPSRERTSSWSTRRRCSPSGSPTRCSARSGRGRTSCSSATSTSSRRSGRAACWRTSSPPGGCRRSR